ncbi:hypothetical protein L195_g033254 [Trifolium pratense]|uniref:Uncharacterized protein n=1 Tax=Trifolium pratense TaxID=57577 RepID=A0A2K3LFH6_TRIPR|nr:hypothetical protein L195_g033254 [Trifolium pratense]
MAWKANHLSFAGRVTLAKSVLEIISIYHMMTNIIPKSCLDDIQKLQSRFTWSDSENVRKYHAIRWETITTPKAVGGLGLRCLNVMNKACILKMGWNLPNGAQDLWCKVLLGKYKRGTHDDHVVAKGTDSTL